MTIHITPDRMIREIQNEFNYVFPYLKIEFFMKASRSEQQGHKKQVISTDLVIGNIHKAGRRGEFWITPLMTVKELEKKCDELYGVSVHIYRRSGNIWLETTMTDNWTMKQQNDNGSELSAPLHRQ